MEANHNDTPPKVLAAAHGRSGIELVRRPFEVRIDGAQFDRFYDLRDATAAAEDAKRQHSVSIVTITDARTTRLVSEIATSF